MISTSQWHAKHPFAGQNTQQIVAWFYLRFRHQRGHTGHEHSEFHEDHNCPIYQWGEKIDHNGDDDDFFSPCHSFFNLRYAIGTHTAPKENLERFASKHGAYKYVRHCWISIVNSCKF